MIEITDNRCADADMLDFRPHAVNLYQIANPDWLFKEENKTADKIIDNALQPETDTDAQGTDHDREFGNLNAKRRNREVKNQQQQ